MRVGVAVFVLLCAAVPAHAGAAPCHATAQAVGSAQYGTDPPIGAPVSCRPGLFCETQCVFTVKISIHGYGIVSGVLDGPFGTLTCGPSPMTCTVASDDFVVPSDGQTVSCSSGTTLAVHVEVVCIPTQLR